MKKSVFALSVAGATLASAIGIAPSAGAFNFTYNNATYDVNTYTGSFNDLRSTLTASNNALWGSPSLAYDLAGVVKGDLGYPNLYGGPYFVYGFPLFSGNPNVVESFYYFNFSGPVTYFTSSDTDDATATYATATAVPEPLTILGSITATGFLAAFNRIKNKKEE